MMMCTLLSFAAPIAGGASARARGRRVGENHRMSGYRSPSVFSLQEALGAAPSLAQLRARRSVTALPGPHSPAAACGPSSNVAAGPLNEGEWCLLVNSLGRGGQGRQLLPLRDKLHENGSQVSSIRIKVQTPGR
jgi:hypothetical protein